MAFNCLFNGINISQQMFIVSRYAHAALTMYTLAHVFFLYDEIKELNGRKYEREEWKTHKHRQGERWHGEIVRMKYLEWNKVKLFTEIHSNKLFTLLHTCFVAQAFHHHVDHMRNRSVRMLRERTWDGVHSLCFPTSWCSLLHPALYLPFHSPPTHTHCRVFIWFISEPFYSNFYHLLRTRVAPIAFTAHAQPSFAVRNVQHNENDARYDQLNE